MLIYLTKLFCILIYLIIIQLFSHIGTQHPQPTYAHDAGITPRCYPRAFHNDTSTVSTGIIRVLSGSEVPPLDDPWVEEIRKSLKEGVLRVFYADGSVRDIRHLPEHDTLTLPSSYNPQQ